MKSLIQYMDPEPPGPATATTIRRTPNRPRTQPTANGRGLPGPLREQHQHRCDDRDRTDRHTERGRQQVAQARRKVRGHGVTIGVCMSTSSSRASYALSTPASPSKVRVPEV